MQITKMIPGKNRKVKICLENGSSFSLYRREAVQYQLEEECEITEDIWQQICEEVLNKRAKKRAMHLLEKMDRTELQLRQKLRENDYPAECIEQAITYVKAFHYIDDQRYASAYIRCHQEKKSRLQLKIALKQKGVSSELIEEALEENYTGSEEKQVLQLLEKKHYDAENMDKKEKYKIYQYLMRRGFSGELIRRCMGL